MITDIYGEFVQEPDPVYPIIDDMLRKAQTNGLLLEVVAAFADNLLILANTETTSVEKINHAAKEALWDWDIV